MKVGKNKNTREPQFPTPEDAAEMTDAQLLAKLKSLGIDMDQKKMEKLCDKVLSAEDLAEPFEEQFDDENEDKGFERERQGDWIWLCFSELWKRWFPDKPCFEILHECITDGFRLRKQRDEAGSLQRWLAGWNIARRMMDAEDVPIEQFHYEFRLENSLCEWVQDVSVSLRNASSDAPDMLPVEVQFYRDVLKRTKANHLDLFVQNMRMNLAEALFDMGKVEEVDKLYEEWLAKDPHWGWGWISWAYCYLGGRSVPENPEKVQKLLEEGLAVKSVRNRLDVLEKMAEFFDAQGRKVEADAAWSEFEKEEAKDASSAPPSEALSSSRKNMFDSPTMTMLKDAIDKVDAEVNSATAPSDTVGRKEPCPCGSGKKYKRCCGK